jgi:hypothetical protein
MAATEIDRDWIASELLRIVASERSLATDAKARAESPPMPALAVLYHEIAEQDERHVAVLETIAARYGHTPTRSTGGGVGETLGRLKDKVVALGAAPTDLLRQDLMAKADAIDHQSAWAHALESISDTQSARALAAVVTEDQAHHDALLEGLKAMLDQRTTGNDGR